MEEAEGDATEVGLDGGGVWVEFQVDLRKVLYVGVPTMVGIVGNGKPSTILSMAFVMVID